MRSDKATPRQTETLRRIAEMTAANGFPPTVRELCAAMGIKSPNGITVHLTALFRLGLITTTPDKARSTVLTPAGRHVLRGSNQMKLFAVLFVGFARIVSADSAESALEKAKNGEEIAALNPLGLWSQQVNSCRGFLGVREIAEGGLLPDRIVWADEEVIVDGRPLSDSDQENSKATHF